MVKAFGYREAFKPSNAKDDPTDAELALGKTLTCDLCAASGLACGRLSSRKLHAALTINRIRSAVSADRMLHKL